MFKIPLNEKMREIARRVVWFEQPETSLADPIRFLAYAMRYATHEDMTIIRGYISNDEFAKALKKIPPGIVDPRSWAYWNNILEINPPLQIPKRRF